MNQTKGVLVPPAYQIFLKVRPPLLFSLSNIGLTLKKENGNPLQYSCLGNPMDRGACQATVHGGGRGRVTKESDKLRD